MMKSIERSLRGLRTTYLDILYVHMWDYMTPVDEVMRGLDDLVKSGKVLYVAVSDTPDWIVAEANTLATFRGWSRFVGLQIPYSLLDRAVERTLLPMARHWDMAVMPWGLLESGVLTGKFFSKTGVPTRIDPQKLELSEKAQSVVKEVQKVAGETGRSMSQVAINWVRQQQNKSQIIPILGARNKTQLQDNLGVLEWTLNDDQLKRLDEVSKIDMGFPHGFLEGNEYIFGSTYDKIDNHHR